MINQKIIQILKMDSKLKNFLENAENFEFLTRRLNLNEIKRLSSEYPNLLKIRIYFDESNKNIIKILWN